MAPPQPNPIIPIEHLKVLMGWTRKKARLTKSADILDDKMGQLFEDAYWENEDYKYNRRIESNASDKRWHQLSRARENRYKRKMDSLEKKWDKLIEKGPRKVNTRELKKIRAQMPPGKERRYERLLRSNLTAKDPKNIMRQIELLTADWSRDQSRREAIKKGVKFAVKPTSALPSVLPGQGTDKIAKTLLRLLTRGRSG